jgi:hypothetical protein
MLFHLFGLPVTLTLYSQRLWLAILLALRAPEWLGFRRAFEPPHRDWEGSAVNTVKNFYSATYFHLNSLILFRVKRNAS